MRMFERVLDQMARDIVKQAQDNLMEERVLEYTKTQPTSNKVASGTLLKSLNYTIRNRNGEYSLTLGADVDYARSVEEGTPEGTIVPMEKLISWILVKPVDTDWAENGILEAGYLFQRAIAQRGIPPELYYQRAVDDVVPRYTRKFADAFGADMIKIFE